MSEMQPPHPFAGVRGAYIEDDNGNELGEIDFEESDTPEQREALYNEARAALIDRRDSAERVAKFAQKIDVTPTKYVPRTRAPLAPSMMGPRAVVGASRSNAPIQEEDEYNAAAAAAGVDLYTGAPATVRAKANLLALSPDAERLALDYFLQKEYEKNGIDLPDEIPLTFKDEYTGKLAYWTTTAKGGLKPTLVNPVGLDSGDVLSGIDDAVQAVGLDAPLAFMGGALGVAAGTPAGMPLQGATVGAVGGAYVAARAAHEVRREVALALGIPKDIVNTITTEDQMSDAMMSAGMELAIPVVHGMVRGLRNARRPLDPRDEATLSELRQKFASAKTLSDDLYKTTGMRIMPTLGQTSGDVDILVAEAGARSDALGKAAKDARRTEYANRLNSGIALERIAERAVGMDMAPVLRDAVSPAQQGESVKAVLLQPATDAAARIKVLEADQQALMDKVADEYSRPTFRGIQNDLEAVTEGFKTKEAEAWANWRTQVGFDPETSTSKIHVYNGPDDQGNPSPLRQVMTRLYAQADQSLAKSLRNSQNGLLRDVGFNAKYMSDYAPKTLTPEGNEGVNLEGMLVGGNDPMYLMKDTLDMHHLHAALSHFKAELRRMDAPGNDNKIKWNRPDVEAVIEAISDQIENGRLVDVTPKRGNSLRSNAETAGPDALPQGGPGTQLDTIAQEGEYIPGRQGGAPGATGRTVDGDVVKSFEDLSPTKTEAIRMSYAMAREITRDAHTMFDEKAAKDLFGRSRWTTGPDDKGDYLKQPGQVRDLLLSPSNPAPLANVLRIVGDNPSVRIGLANELDALFKRQVYTDAGLNKTAIDNFVDQYGDHINLITGRDGRDFVGTARDFARQLDEAKKAAERTKADLARAYGRRLTQDEQYGGNVVVDMLTDRLTLEQTQQIKNSVGRSSPELWQSIQANGMEFLKDRMLKNSGTEGAYGAINNTLRDHGDRLAVIYGQRYVDNLGKLRDMLNTTARGGGVRADKYVLNPPMLQLTRTLMGVMNPIQRRLTAGMRFKQRAEINTVLDLMSNPERVDAFVKLPYMRPGTLTYANAAMAAGFGIDELDPDTQVIARRMEEVRQRAPQPSPTMQQLRAINQQRGSAYK